MNGHFMFMHRSSIVHERMHMNCSWKVHEQFMIFSQLQQTSKLTHEINMVSQKKMRIGETDTQAMLYDHKVFYVLLT